MNLPTMRLSPRKCDRCSKPYSSWGPLCAECDQVAREEQKIRIKKWDELAAQRRAKAREEAEAANIEQREQWKRTFANEFPGGIDHNRIPDAPGHDLGIEWLKARQALNLFVHGDTGTGKTLLIQAIAAHLADDFSASDLWSGAVVLTDGMDFQNAVPDRVRGVYRVRESDDDEDDGSLEFYVSRIRDARFWLCDEAGQLKGTPRVTAELLKLLNERHRQHVPTILASFLAPADWCKELNKTDHQYGRQIARRLDDWFQIIELKKGRT